MNRIPKSLYSLKPGRYIVAVSGGVDSMVMLAMLRQISDVEIIVAHADHGIRSDSHLDSVLVKKYCTSHNIKYRTKKLHLMQTSESEARQARYAFLQQCRILEQADAILTAHHNDDLIETVLINMLRGTGWRGLAPFRSQQFIIRPLLYITKSSLIKYATTHRIPWRTDSTNQDQTYLRNYVRHTLIPLLDAKSKKWRGNIMRLIRKQLHLRRTIEAELTTYAMLIFYKKAEHTLSLRYTWCMLPDREAYELLQWLCRHMLGHSLLRDQAQRLLIFIKIAKPDKTMPLNNAWRARVTMRDFIVEPHPTVLE